MKHAHISTVEEALDVITHVRKLASDALEIYRTVFKSQLAGAKPSEKQLRDYLAHIEQALDGLGNTQRLVDMTRDLRAQLAETDDGTVQ